MTMFDTYSPRLAHYIFPLAVLVAGALAMPYNVLLGCGLWALSACMVVFIQSTAVIAGRINFAYAVASLASSLSHLDSEGRRALGFRFPELRLYASMGGPVEMLGDSGVSWEWFKDVFMEGSNALSTVSLRSLIGPDREQERQNWQAVIAYLDSVGMLAAAPRGAETYQWRVGCYEYWRMQVSRARTVGETVEAAAEAERLATLGLRPVPYVAAVEEEEE